MEKLKNKILNEVGIEVRIEERPENTFAIWYGDIVLVDYCDDENIENIKLALEICKKREVVSAMVGIKRVQVTLKNGTIIAGSSWREKGQLNVVYLEEIDKSYDEIQKILTNAKEKSK